MNVEQTIFVLEDVPIRLFDVRYVCSAGVWDFHLFEFYKHIISAAYVKCFELWFLFAVCYVLSFFEQWSSLDFVKINVVSVR